MIRWIVSWIKSMFKSVLELDEAMTKIKPYNLIQVKNGRSVTIDNSILKNLDMIPNDQVSSCKYCSINEDDTKYLWTDSGDSTAVIRGDILVVCQDDCANVEIAISKCPACGRRLNDYLISDDARYHPQ